MWIGSLDRTEYPHLASPSRGMHRDRTPSDFRDGAQAQTQHHLTDPTGGIVDAMGR